MMGLAFLIQRHNSFFSFQEGEDTFFTCLGEKDSAAIFVSEVDSAIKKQNKQWSDISYASTSNGPGSFSSIRLGLSFLHGIQLSNPEIICITFNTFDILKKAATNVGIDTSLTTIGVNNARGGFFMQQENLSTTNKNEGTIMITDTPADKKNTHTPHAKEMAMAIHDLAKTTQNSRDIIPNYGHTPTYKRT